MENPDMVEVVSRFIDLEVNGGRFFGICPACREIVWIYPERQVAWCEGSVFQSLPERNVYQYLAHALKD